jgi:hypothetical protein
MRDSQRKRSRERLFFDTAETQGVSGDVGIISVGEL